MGPQSEADAREFIANRDKVRRDSLNASTSSRPSFGRNPSALYSPSSPQDSDKILGTPTEYHNGASLSPHPTPTSFQQPTPPPSDSGQEEEQRQDKEMFLALEKPRVRYDVEVVTKLVVYAGE